MAERPPEGFTHLGVGQVGPEDRNRVRLAHGLLEARKDHALANRLDDREVVPEAVLALEIGHVWRNPIIGDDT